MIYEFFVEPLVEYSFLRRAVAGTFVLSLGARACFRALKDAKWPKQ